MHMHIFLIFFPLDGGIAAILNLAMSRGRASTNQTIFAGEGRTQQKYNAHALSPILFKHT